MRQCVKEDESSEYEDTTGDRAKLHQVKISSGIPKITSGDIYKKKKKMIASLRSLCYQRHAPVLTN